MFRLNPETEKEVLVKAVERYVLPVRKRNTLRVAAAEEAKS